jgi:DNA polymerase III epsilon subunit family exonuclease
MLTARRLIHPGLPVFVMPFTEPLQRTLFITPSQTLKRLFAYLRNHGGALSGSQAVKRSLNLRGKAREFYVEIAGMLFGQDEKVFETLDEDTYRLRPLEQFNIPLEKATFAVLDIETTGGKPPYERVTEVAVMRIDGRGQELSRYSTLVNPKKKIPPYVIRHTGISDEMVKSAPTIDKVLPEILNVLEGNILVVHDSFADMQFLDYDSDRMFDGLISLPLLNTQHLAERYCPEIGGLGLSRVADYLGIEIGERHRALADAELTGRVLTNFLGKVNGQTIYDVYLNTAAENSYIRPGPNGSNQDH